jgi:copper transport protein
MRAIATVVVIVAALANAGAAHAHASLIQSEPADRAILATAPDELRLTFNEPVSPIALRMVGSDGSLRELTDIAIEALTVVVRLPRTLPLGTHLLSWRVVSADGHPVGGSLTFSIGAPSAVAPRLDAGEDPWRRSALWLVKVGLGAGIFGGIGGVFYAAWLARRPLPGPTAWVVAALIDCGLVSAVLSIGIEGTDVLGVPLGGVLEPRAWAAGLATSSGTTAIVATASLALARVALIAAGWRWLSAVAIAGAAAAFAASGHASAAEPQWLTRPAVFLHTASLIFWIGALLPLANALRARRIEELRLFSRMIPLPLAILVASGAALAIVQLRQVASLWTTDYGLVLSAKLAAVAVLLAVAAGNRLSTPRALAGDARALTTIGRSTRIEIAIVVVILGLAASWRFTPPPRALLDAASTPIHAHFHDARAMVDITIEPNGQGGRRITIVVLDHKSEPLSAKEVALTLAKPDAGIEPLRLHAVYVEATIWRIADARIPLPGRWVARVEVLINDFEKVIIDGEVGFRG